MTTASGHTKAIRATRVIGTPVYCAGGDKIGEIEDVMLDKTNNAIMFGVIGFGGFLGLGEKFHPVPWTSLTYNSDKNGYVVPFSAEELKAAPAHSLSELTENDGHNVREAAFNYYQAPQYW